MNRKQHYEKRIQQMIRKKNNFENRVKNKNFLLRETFVFFFKQNYIF